MTIGVRDDSGALHPMPVIRYDNFNDVTADVDSSRFWLKVGNETGDDLRAVSLAEVLQETKGYLHDEGSWAAEHVGLWADRDEEVLVSAQAVRILLRPPHRASSTRATEDSLASARSVACATSTRETVDRLHSLPEDSSFDCCWEPSLVCHRLYSFLYPRSGL